MKRVYIILIYSIIIASLIIYASCSNTNKTDDYQSNKNYYEENDDVENEVSGFDEHDDDYNTLSKKIKHQKTDFLDVEIEFGSGTFNMGACSKDLADISFYYEKEHWKPIIDYDYASDTSQLSIRLNREVEYKGDHKNKCNIKLSDQQPMNLSIAFGAGESNLKMSELDLNKVDFALGAGDFDIDLSGASPQDIDVVAGVGSGVFDLSGKWNNDCSADFACGIGDLTIKLPKKTGVKIEVAGLIGNVDAFGLKKIAKKTYVNEAYQKSDHTIDIDIAGGLGNIDLVLKD